MMKSSRICTNNSLSTNKSRNYDKRSRACLTRQFTQNLNRDISLHKNIWIIMELERISIGIPVGKDTFPQTLKITVRGANSTHLTVQARGRDHIL